MSDKTRYKESPHDERIEELALDIEATKNKGNKREHFWRCFAVFSAAIIFSMWAWGTNRAGELWGRTLEVAKVQEERAADALSQSGEQHQKIAQLHEKLAAMQKDLIKQDDTSKRWQKLYAQEIQRRIEILGLSRELLMTMQPKDSKIPAEKFNEWINELQSKKRMEVAKLIVEAWREQENRTGNLKIPDVTTNEHRPAPDE